MQMITAPRCVKCHGECPNGLKDFPLFAICQNKECWLYGVFQAWEVIMKNLDDNFPYIAEWFSLAYTSGL